jgi:hypothetical protein
VGSQIPPPDAYHARLMDSIAWIVALPLCAGGVGLFLPSARVVTGALLAALALHLLVLSPALAVGAQPPLVDASAWLILEAPPLVSWVPLLLCLLAAAAGARERLDAGASAWAGLVAAACTLALCSPSLLVGTSALFLGGVFALCGQQRGTLGENDCELGVGTHLLVAGAGVLTLGLVTLGPEGLAGSPAAWPLLAGALLCLPAYALTRTSANGQRAPGFLLAGALALTVLSWFQARGVILPQGWGWLGLALAVVSSLDAAASSALDRSLRGWWLAALGLGWASLCWGGGGQTLAGGSLILATLSLSAESAATVSGSWEPATWRGLRRSAPGASGAAALALAATFVPGGLWQRELRLESQPLSWALGLGALLLIAGPLRILPGAIRGAAARPQRGPRLHLAYVPALFAAGLALQFLPNGRPLWTPSGLDTAGLDPVSALLALGAIALAFGLSRLPLARVEAAREHFERVAEPYSPQRRLVQPILGQARKSAARELRWFEGSRVAGALARLLRACFRSPPLLEAALSERPFERTLGSPWRRVAIEVAIFLAALVVALVLLRS